MVRNRLLTDALREVRATRSRFLSILLLCALATAFLSGIRNTAPDMHYTADRYFDRMELMDGYVLSTLGLTHEDVQALAAAPGVLFAEGGSSVDAQAGERIVVVRSIPQRLNRYEILAGRDAERADECVTEERLLIELGLSIGDTLTLAPGEDDTLTRRRFTIVGTARSPLYLSTDRGSSSLGTGSVDAFVYVPAENFDVDYYTVAYFAVEGLAALNSYTDEYDQAVQAQFDAMEPLADERAQLRYDSLIGDARKKLDDAREELETQRADAQRELDEAAEQLADARAGLDDGWAEYADGLRALETQSADGLRALDEAAQALADAREALTDGWAQYRDGAAQLADAREAYEAGLAEYLDGLAQYEDARAQYEQALEEYEDGKRQYEAGLADYRAGRSALDEGYAQLMEGEAQYQAGCDQLYGNEQLAAAAQLLGMTSEELVAQLSSGELPVNEALSAAREALSAAREALANGSESAEENIARVRAAIAEARARLEESGLSEEEKQELLALLAQLENELAAAEEDYAAFAGRWTAEIVRLEAELDTLEAGLRAAKEGYAALQEARRQLDENWEAYYDGAALLSGGKAQLDAVKAQLDDAWAQLEEGRAQLDEVKAQLDDAWAGLEEGRVQLEDGEAQSREALDTLEQSERDLADGEAQLAQGRETYARELADGKKQLADAKAQLEDGEAEYRDGLAEYEDGKAELETRLEDAEAQLAEAQRELDDVEECQWYVLGRSANVGVVSFEMDSSRVSNLAKVFPLIFFLVAALACLTTMTRMVEEQRTQIGSMKALGFGRAAISIKYIGYAFSASLIGGLAGLLIGRLIPLVIANAFNIIYAVPALELQSHPVSDSLAVAAAVLCTTGAAWWACGATLSATPAALMRPKAPAAGKRVFLERITPLWKSLSFTWKVTMRNLFRYQKRFWMTVIGIGGCTALIVTGFGLHNSIFDILDKQFDEITRYDAKVGLERHLTGAQQRVLAAYLDGEESIAYWDTSYQSSVDALSDARTVEGVTIFTARDTQELLRFVDLRERKGGAQLALEDDGVVITEKLSELLEVNVGDTLVIDGARRVEARVTAIAENYIQHYIFLTEDCYARLMRENPEDNIVLLTFHDGQESAAERVSVELMRMESVTSYSEIAALRDTFTESMNSIDYAVVIIIVAAAALAFVVLYNLTNINITERMRELATLKVLGFYDGEISAYVYRENIILTAFGIVLGLWMGRLLHAWMVLTVEVDYAMFGRVAPPHAYVLAAALTVLFSVVVNVAAHYKLKKVDMVESLKTVE